MDLTDTLNHLSSKILKQRDLLQTEEATKNALVMPLINALGYNVFDPSEVIPEFTADVGTKKGEKVDYAIMHEAAPMILIECKAVSVTLNESHASQLFRYFSATPARFGVLTNGVDYYFYTDLDSPNVMDRKPFFEMTIARLDDRAVSELKKFSKNQFDLGNILSNASELKYGKEVKRCIADELDSPSEDFVKLFVSKIYDGRFTPTVKEQFSRVVADAFRDFINDAVNGRLQSALNAGSTNLMLNKSSTDVQEDDQGEDEASEIVTTPEEIEGFHIVRAILSQHVDADRVVMRDTKSYCGILLDNNNRKPICRLRFNYSQKYVGVFDREKAETKHPIGTLKEIYQLADCLIETVSFYDEPASGEQESAEDSSSITEFPAKSISA